MLRFRFALEIQRYAINAEHESAHNEKRDPEVAQLYQSYTNMQELAVLRLKRRVGKINFDRNIIFDLQLNMASVIQPKITI